MRHAALGLIAICPSTHRRHPEQNRCASPASTLMACEMCIKMMRQKFVYTRLKFLFYLETIDFCASN